jgi:hypothetical protein
VNGPKYGSLFGRAPNLTYIPHANFNGADSFTFKVNDGTVDSTLAGVLILVKSANDPPVAESQTLTTSEDKSGTLTLSGSDLDGDSLSFAVVDGPANGTLSGTAPNLTYTPHADFNGLDSFTFKVSDGNFDSDTATVLISVNPANDTPVANSQTVSVNENSSIAITLTGDDVDGDALSYFVLSDPLNGSLSGTGSNLTYTPQPNFTGTDSFAFEVRDGTGASEMAAVLIKVNPVEEAPTISDIALRLNGIDNPNRSGVASLMIEFGQKVWVDSTAALKIYNHTTGTPIDITQATLHDNGTAQVKWDLSEVDFPAGRYTAELAKTGVAGTVDQATLASPFTAKFHVLPGDSNGDEMVDFLDYMTLQNNFNLDVGPLGPGDYDGSGTADIEDFRLLQNNYHDTLLSLAPDFGDVPEMGTSFATTLAENGARHMLSTNLRLGTSIDGEPDGQPSPSAIGDDNASDDDGVSFGLLRADANASVKVTARVPSGAPVLNAWVDFNADGDWSDSGEQIFVDQPVINGENDLTVSVPSNAVVGSVFARFRLTNTPGYSYDGLAPDGEVEDYQLSILPALRTTAAENLGAALLVSSGSHDTPVGEQAEPDKEGTSSDDPRVVDLALLQVTSSHQTRRQLNHSPADLNEDLVDQVFDSNADLLLEDI